MLGFVRHETPLFAIFMAKCFLLGFAILKCEKALLSNLTMRENVLQKLRDMLSLRAWQSVNFRQKPQICHNGLSCHTETLHSKVKYP